MNKAKKYPTLAFGRRKRIDINKFKGNVYLHIHDLIKDKSISLQKEEFDLLLRMKNKIYKKIEKAKKMKNDNKTEKSKKKKKDKEENLSSASSSENEMETSESDSE